jgi:hypothetical protein
MKSLFLLLFVSASGTVFAQNSVRFTLTRYAVASGGATASNSSRFLLSSTIAQPVAGVRSNGRFSVQVGFGIWPAPMVFGLAKVRDTFLLSFQTELGKSYTAQYADSLTVVNWQSLEPVSGSGTVKTITNSVPGVEQRFYRLIEQ